MFRLARSLFGFLSRSWSVLDRHLSRVPFFTLVAGSIGLFLGFVIADLLSQAIPFARLPGPAGIILPTLLALVLGYLGLHLFLRKQDEFSQLFAKPQQLARPSQEEPPRLQEPRYLIDTSVLIDGRIADIARTGFLQGTLLVPNFVLDELRHIADSSDLARRNRGRRGLDVLTKLNREKNIPIRMVRAPTAEGFEVDNRLIDLAKTMPAFLLTIDSNLGKVAEFQGVKVLNIHELVSSLKPRILPGDEMEVQIIQEGREADQGIAFLDDGTMIVVEGGKRYMNQDVIIVVLRILQIPSGRMVFAKPK